jgi:glycosyltransferase involved in cell wall biosynthesis
MRVLVVTSEFPTPARPQAVPFIYQEVQYLCKAGIDLEVFHFRGNQNPLNYLKSWMKLRTRYNLSQYDVIHAHFGQSALLVLPTGTPLVVTFHGSDLQGIVGRNGNYTMAGQALRHLSKLVAKRARGIIVSSERLKKFLSPGLPVKVISPGIDLRSFRPLPRSQARRQLGLPSDKRLVLFAAHPQDPVKRFPLAQQAVASLPGRFAAELVALGGVQHQSVPLYMNACDVLLITSKHEGSPTVLKEALACNLPVVSVDVGDVRSRIGHVSGCVVCDNDLPDTIAGGLAKVLTENRRLQGREQVIGLDVRLVVQKIIEVYRSALAAG